MFKKKLVAESANSTVPNLFNCWAHVQSWIERCRNQGFNDLDNHVADAGVSRLAKQGASTDWQEIKENLSFDLLWSNDLSSASCERGPAFSSAIATSPV